MQNFKQEKVCMYNVYIYDSRDMKWDTYEGEGGGLTFYFIVHSMPDSC